MKAPSLYPPVIPYLTASDAAKTIEFYQKAFDAQELYRLVDKGTGKIGHAELTIQGQIIMIADEFQGMCTSPKTLNGVTARMVVMVTDTDEAYSKAINAGGTSIRPPADQFYGFRMAVVADPSGQEWAIQQQVEQMEPEEMQRRWDAMADKCSEKKEA
ncbi:VOC family protein [Brevifollis gellanilyticus]|uniref:Glycosylase n=1 Tax=Brevifollis gellanilyticus TaxID=748831 RepID=A0A512MEZ2_9BACT|nr:VOC family protein [Brevifollis gellanilyticus]GEP45305.1 glycosylase [Brevifollis gellanilyticus]